MTAVSGTVIDGWLVFLALCAAGLVLSLVVDLRRRYWAHRARRAAQVLQEARRAH